MATELTKRVGDGSIPLTSVGDAIDDAIANALAATSDIAAGTAGALVDASLVGVEGGVASLDANARLVEPSRFESYVTPNPGSDVTASLQADLTANNYLIIPPGIFFITGLEWTADNQHVFGAGPERTILRLSGAGKGFANSNSASIRKYCSLHNLSIQITEDAQVGVEFDNTLRCTMHHVRIDGAGRDCIGVDFVGSATKSTYYNFLYDCEITSNGTAVRLGDQCNRNGMFGGVIDGSGKIFDAVNDTSASDTWLFMRVAMANTGGGTKISVGEASAACNQFHMFECPVEIDGDIVFGSLANFGQIIGGSLSNDVDLIYPAANRSHLFLIPGRVNIDQTRRQMLISPAATAGYDTQSLPAWFPMANISVLTSGQMSLQRVWLEKGQTVKKVSYFSGTQAAVSPTNQWAALYSSGHALLAVTADRTSTAWGANAKQDFTFATAYVPQTSGWYYVGLVVVASTVPSLEGSSQLSTTIQSVESTLPYAYAATGDTGLTDPASAPSSISTRTVQNIPYVSVARG